MAKCLRSIGKFNFMLPVSIVLIFALGVPQCATEAIPDTAISGLSDAAKVAAKYSLLSSSQLQELEKRISDLRDLDPANLDVSTDCWNNSMQYANNVVRLLSPTYHLHLVPPWTLKMLDATAKFPSGILQVYITWIGSFSECVKIRADDEGFAGQYCRLTFDAKKFEFLKHPFAALLDLAHISMDICWPSTCNETELGTMLNLILSGDIVPVTKVVKPGYCQKEESVDLDTPTIAVTAIFGVCGAILVCATIFEVVYMTKLRRSLKIIEDDTEQLPDIGAASTITQLVLSFSLYRNYKLLRMANSSITESMKFLNGLQFMSLLWVMFGQIFLYALTLPIKDLWDIFGSTDDWAMDIILNYTFAFDSMLFVSGFSVAYTFLHTLKNRKHWGFFDLLLFYLYKICRLTPILAVVVAFLAGPYYLIRSGPNWPLLLNDRSRCRTDWWKTILYINNLFDTEYMCVIDSWFISLEMQFYIVAPLILYPLYRLPILGYIILAIFCIVTTLTPGLYIYFKDIPGFPGLNILLMPNSVDTLAYNINIYMKPWCRMGPYLVGIMLAYYLYQRKEKIRIKPLVLLLGWCCALALGLTLVFGTVHYFSGKKQMSNSLNAAYGALSRPAWSLAVAWVALVCATGNGGAVNKFLSWPIFTSWNNMHYSIYLSHLYLTLAIYESQEATFFFDIILLLIVYIGIVIMDIGVSIVLYLAFEAPVIALENVVKTHRATAAARKKSIESSYN